MASEPVHFIIDNATWASYEATLAQECHVMSLPDYVVCTRQNIDAGGVLTAFRAIPGVTEVAHSDISDFAAAHPEIFPVEA